MKMSCFFEERDIFEKHSRSYGWENNDVIWKKSHISNY